MKILNSDKHTNVLMHELQWKNYQPLDRKGKIKAMKYHLLDGRKVCALSSFVKGLQSRHQA